MLTIAAGWMLTVFLGRVAEKEFKVKVNREATLATTFLHHNLDDVVNAAKSLSHSEQIAEAVISGSPADLARANRILDRYKNSFELSVCYLLDRNGLCVASSNRNKKNGFVGKSFAFRPFFTGALAGRLTTYFALGLITRERGYFAAAPVIDNSGAITGVVVIKIDVALAEESFRKYAHAFLISPEGIIFITSTEELLYRSLWPVDEKRRSELAASKQFGNISFKPLLAAEPRTGTYVMFENEKHYVQRLPFGSDGWTLVFMDAPHIVANYHLFGILVTSVFGLLLAFSFYVLLQKLLQKEKSLAAARELREAHQRALDIIQFYPEATMVVDSERKVVAWNLAMEELTGVRAEEMLGRGNYEYALPFYGERRPILIDFALQPTEKFDGHYQYTERSAQIIIGETFVHNTQGDNLYVQGTAVALYNSSGEISGAIESIRDITSRKRIDLELAKQARLASLRAEIGGALGKNLDLQSILQSCAELLVQHLDVAFFRIWTLNDAEQTLEMQASAGMYTHIDGPHCRVPVGKFKIGMIASERQPHLTNDVLNDPRIGDKEWARREGMIAFAGYPLIVAERLVGVMATFARTTLNEEIIGELGSVAGRIAQGIERKWLEAELKKAKSLAENYAQRLEFVLEGSNDATWEWDVIADQWYLNTRYYEMIECIPGEEEPTFEFFLKTIHPDDVSEVHRRVQEHLDGKTNGYGAHYRMVTKMGKVRHVIGKGKIVKYDEDGQPITMAGIVADVTELKKLGDEVNRIHNLEAIALLAGGMAHDFNNVLNVIYGNVSFAKMLVGGNTAVAEPLTDAEEACERAKDLGIRLQAFSQGTSLSREQVVLPAIIGDAAGTLFRDSDISHILVAAEDLLPVEADPKQIRQLFENLLANAKEAMTAGGTVKINIENYIVEQKMGLPIKSGNYVRVALQDNGKGIPEENLSKIFNPYFSTKDTYSQKGLGLGLTVCHAILKRHYGHVLVESKAGIGTEVTVYLPTAEEITELKPEG